MGQEKFNAQLRAWKKFYNLGPCSVPANGHKATLSIVQKIQRLIDSI